MSSKEIVGFNVRRRTELPSPHKRPGEYRPSTISAAMNIPNRENVSPAKSRRTGELNLPRTSSDAPITPIKLISPFLAKYSPRCHLSMLFVRYRICGKVTHKEALKNIKTRFGESKVFNFVITDEAGDSIRLTAFADTADRYYATVQTDFVQPSCYLTLGIHGYGRCSATNSRGE